MTRPPHIILCGNLRPRQKLPKAAQILPLTLWHAGASNSVTLRIEDIHTRLLRDVPPQFADLLEIASYVFCADQAIPRGGLDVDTFGSHWRRHFEFHIPVRVPDLWQEPKVSESLVSLLNFLSDETFAFSFYPATNPPRLQQYLDLSDHQTLSAQPESVLLFSGGLDSLAGAIRESVVQKRNIVLVNHRSTSKHNRRHSELQRQLASHAGDYRPLHINVRVHKKSDLNKEYTQRTRSFLYASLGATVAEMLGISQTTFYENGIVSLNLPLCAQVTGSRATRTTHPRVLNAFQELFTLVAARRFAVANPYLWHTKGDVIREILTANCAPLIATSCSCAHTWQTTIAHPHCGSCSQCVDRRFGILAVDAAAHDPASGYENDVFIGVPPKDVDKLLYASYIERARLIRSVKDVHRFLQLYPEVAYVLPHLGCDNVSGAARVHQLYRRHAEEVHAALQIAMNANLSAVLDQTLPASCLLRIAYESNLPQEPPAQLPKPSVSSSPSGDGREFVTFHKNDKILRFEVDGHEINLTRKTALRPFLHYLLVWCEKAKTAEFEYEIVVEDMNKTMGHAPSGRLDHDLMRTLDEKDRDRIIRKIDDKGQKYRLLIRL